LTGGKPQTIPFPESENVKAGTPYLEVAATSDRKLPVQYYVRSGPAYVRNGELVFTELPPKTKFPVKITVVAWQHGSMIEPLIQTATPVERTFYMEKQR
jgi:hypothetical protein